VPAAAIQAFLSLNAAHFLGEWLPARLHARLVRRLAAALDGLADVPIPESEPSASQLAQHARELAVLYGPTDWTERIAAQSSVLISRQPAAWDVPVCTAFDVVRDGMPLGGDVVDALLLAHARRRLWELANAVPGDDVPRGVPGWARRFARDAAERGDGRMIQAAEALLAELTYAHPMPDACPFDRN
jgi:hypothetical protein